MPNPAIGLSFPFCGLCHIRSLGFVKSDVEMLLLRHYLTLGVATVASMFLGSSLVHNVYKPDMRLDVDLSEYTEEIKKEENELKAKYNL